MLWKEAVEAFKKDGLETAIVNKPIKKRVRAKERGVEKEGRVTTNTFVVRAPRLNNFVLYRKNVKVELEKFYDSVADPVVLRGIIDRHVALARRW
jgi:hypothetical protein